MKGNPTYAELEQRVKELENQLLAPQGAYGELERQLVERTAELARTNQELKQEINERQGAQDTLSATYCKLQATFNSIQEIINVVDLDFNLTDVNDVIVKVFGLPDKGSVIGRKCYEALKGRKEPCPNCAVAEAYRTRAVARRTSTPEDEKSTGGRCFEIFAYPIMDEQGAVTGAVEFARDVTERKRAAEALKKAHAGLEIRVQERTAQLAEANEELRRKIEERIRAEEALRESKETVRALLNAPFYSALLLDDAGNILAINNIAARILGKGEDELIGACVYDLLPSGVAKSRKAQIDKVFQSRKPMYFEDEREGRIIDNHYYPLFGLQGKVKRVAIFAQDITERKQAEEALRASEQKFRALFDNIPAIAFVVDRDHRLVTGNKAFTEMMGKKAGSKTLDLKVAHPTVRQFWYNVEKQVIESGQPTRYVEMVNSPKGSLYFESRKQPIKDQDGKVTMILGIASDITADVKNQIALAREAKELRSRISAEIGPAAIVGKSKPIADVFGRIKAISATDTTVLLTGESGTGKELVAEAVHSLSQRAKSPLIRVNCAALSQTIIESELFGHVKGAFTGAASTRIGRFEAAHGGTIFFDEIGEMPAAVQIRLLRVLEEKTVERVGDYRPINVDVRIIAATNQNIERLVEKGRFRRDLYYRLNVFRIHIPPLRDRMDDVPLLVAHFLRDFSKIMKKKITSISSEVMAHLLRHTWPGNVRELMNVIESACVLCAGETIQLEHLPPLLESRAVDIKTDRAMEIREALGRTGGNKAEAARHLGIARQTLYRRIKAYESVTDVTG